MNRHGLLERRKANGAEMIVTTVVTTEYIIWYFDLSRGAWRESVQSYSNFLGARKATMEFANDIDLYIEKRIRHLVWERLKS